MKFILVLISFFIANAAVAELKYETPNPVTVSEKSEAKCGVAENTQALLTEASAFMKANWNVGKVEDKAKLQELIKKIAEFDEKLGYGRYCYDRHGDYAGARVFNRALKDLHRFDRKLYRANGPVRGRFDFPFPGGGIHFELNF